METITYDFLKLALTDASVFNANMQHYALLNGLSDKIQWSWENWDDEVTQPFWKNDEKTDVYTNSFAEDWLDNEDFEADGYNSLIAALEMD